MSKNKLFDEDSEEDVAIKTENEYAKRYDAWREKEERHKLEQKYGSKALDSDASISTDTEDESDEPLEVSEETEAQFLKTLSLLKTKDPRIYDPSYKFFDEKAETEKEKESVTKKVVFADSDDDDDDDGAIFRIENKAEINDQKQDIKKEGKLKDYLTGKAEHVEEEVEKDLAPLKALWSDPKLSEGEAFLRDYILKKRYLEEGDAGEAGDKIRDDADLEADEELVEEQGKFERAYNFRFEEPDDEYLKRFPRTMNYIRPKDDRRSRKRAEVRARKEAEKRSKMEAIARLKALKLKEVREKIAKLKEVTGNQVLAFNDEDIEGDFDPEEHDKRMKAIFDEQYYGEADDQKPVFPDLDEELEIENWENYENECNEDAQGKDEGPHCEDEDFNMDADYDPKKARENLLEELKRNMGKKHRNRKKKSKLADLLAEEKPKFVPEKEKSYAEFMEEYYKMDCEDVIGGDLPTRFKYREVVPNDYGLSIEEMLLADDKELTQWVPLKKIVKHRPPNAEKSEVKTYAMKAADVQLKKKILPSLFKDLPQEPELVLPAEENEMKKKKKNKSKQMMDTQCKENKKGNNAINDKNIILNTEGKMNKKKEKELLNDHTDINNLTDNVQDTHEEKLNSNPDVKKKKKKDKIKNESYNSTVHDSKTNDSINVNDKVNLSTKKEEHEIANDSHKDLNNGAPEGNKKEVVKGSKKKKQKNNNFTVAYMHGETPNKSSDDTPGTEPNDKLKKAKIKRKLESTIQEVNEITPNKRSKIKNKSNMNKNKFKRKPDKSNNPLNKLSDERLKAYGLNPKKYRGFLKYKKF